MEITKAELTERHVQAVWYDASLRPRQFWTSEGEPVWVVSPGEWNLEAGPDFRQAVLEVGEGHRRVEGDVEVHLCPTDWDLHGHGADPAYRNVIAHVTWKEGEAPASLPPGTISIWLGRLMESGGFRPESVDLMAYPYAKLPLAERPCARVLANNPDLARKVLASAGRHRLQMKARRLAGRLAERMGQNREEAQRVRRQVFYEEVMSAFGYKRNTVQFRHVAERVPYVTLPTESAEAQNALLVAGEFEEWNRSGMRPNNTPDCRLRSAGAMFSTTPVMSYAEGAEFSRTTCREMQKGLCGNKCIGKGRAAAILANVIIPFALAGGYLQDAPDWLPPEDISSPVRLTAFRLFGRDHNPRQFYADNGLLVQGLLQIHRDYCLEYHPQCENCTLME